MTNKETIPNIHPIKLLGSGSFGYVFEAEDPITKEKFAVKRMRKAEKYVSREFKILQELSGSNRIIQIFDLFYTKDLNERYTQNFLMEYVPNSLENLIQNFRNKKIYIPFEKIKKIIFQLLEGIKFAHSKNICHRDLKPDNILLDENGNVKICDFGSAKIISNKINVPHIVSRYYRPPELIFCLQEYDTSVDIWTIGCIFCEMFTKEPLFQGNSEGSQFLEIASILGYPDENVRKVLYKYVDKKIVELLNQFSKLKPYPLLQLFPKYYNSHDMIQAHDLISKMIKWLPSERITATKALNHCFFSNK